MIKFEDVRQNPYILEFIKQTDMALDSVGYTDHGIRHANLVSERSEKLAEKIGLSERDQELCAIAGFCHDMGNFLSRTNHHYWGALLFSQIFLNQTQPEELTILIQAISNHDREEMRFTNAIAAVTVLADKSDAHRSRVKHVDMANLRTDIHDRVNYAVEESSIDVDTTKKEITLVLKIDTKFCPIMEYFAIFTERMMYCRQAADALGYNFSLEINHFKLL
jgi:uncharacterized protein